MQVDGGPDCKSIKKEALGSKCSGLISLDMKCTLDLGAASPRSPDVVTSETHG